MPGTIRFSRGGPACLPALRIAGWTDAGSGSRYVQAFRTWDLFLSFLNTNQWQVPLPLDNIGSLMGIQGDYSSPLVSVGNAPFPVPPLQRQEVELEVYRSFADNLRQFKGFLFGEQGSPPLHHREHVVRHATFSGDLGFTMHYVPAVPYSITYGDLTVDTTYLTEPAYVGGVAHSTAPLAVSLYNVDNVGGFRSPLTDLLDAIINHGDLLYYVFLFGPQFATLSGLRYWSDQFGIHVRWHGNIRTLPDPVNGGFDDDCHWDGFLDIDWRDTSDRDVLVLDTGYPFKKRVSVAFGFTNAHRTSSGFGPEGSTMESWTTPGYLDTFVLAYDGLLSGGTGSEEQAASRLSSYQSDLTRLYKWVESERRDLASATMFSSVDAIYNLEKSPGINLLQNLQKIPDIASAIPQITEGIDVASRILRRDLSLSTFKEVLDLVTSTKLQSDFQWRPFLKVFTEYVPRISSMLAAFRVERPSAVGRGSYRFAFPPGTAGRDELTLVCRTKIVLDTSYQSWLQTILGVDALGLLPKVSNLWDLVPFTFVVNWFTGVGQSLRNIEYSLLLADMPAYYVHSYTFQSPYSQRELTLANMTNVSQHRFSLRVFIRDVSLYSPTPRDTKFGFGIPTQLPPLGTMGSLLYQLLLA